MIRLCRALFAGLAVCASVEEKGAVNRIFCFN